MFFLPSFIRYNQWILGVVSCLVAIVSVLGGAEGIDQGPIELVADELRYEAGDEKVFAEGNVEVKKGEATLKANRLIGLVHKSAKLPSESNLEGRMELRKIEAFGQVRYSAPREMASGAQATYDTERDILVLKGNPAEVTMGESTLRGDIIEFDRSAYTVVSTHNVVLSEPGQILKAQRIVAHFKEQKDSDALEQKTPKDKSKLVLKYADAEGGVEIIAPPYKGEAETARVLGDTITFQGKVRIAQGQSLVVGDCGWYQMKEKTGGVRQCPTDCGAKLAASKRVRALFYAKKMDFRKRKAL